MRSHWGRRNRGKRWRATCNKVSVQIAATSTASTTASPAAGQTPPAGGGFQALLDTVSASSVKSPASASDQNFVKVQTPVKGQTSVSDQAFADVKTSASVQTSASEEAKKLAATFLVN